jgi:propionaldehyde dehydrogenase
VYELNAEEAAKVAELVLVHNKEKDTYYANKAFVGKDAKYILQNIGKNDAEGIECLIYRAENCHPFVQEELMMPILPIEK